MAAIYHTAEIVYIAASKTEGNDRPDIFIAINGEQDGVIRELYAEGYRIFHVLKPAYTVDFFINNPENPHFKLDDGNATKPASKEYAYRKL